jgi:hypothetical protein
MRGWMAPSGVLQGAIPGYQASPNRSTCSESKERVAPDTTKYSKPSVIGAITKKTSEPQASRYTRPGPNHPWRRPFTVHIDKR